MRIWEVRAGPKTTSKARNATAITPYVIGVKHARIYGYSLKRTLFCAVLFSSALAECTQLRYTADGKEYFVKTARKSADKVSSLAQQTP